MKCKMFAATPRASFFPPMDEEIKAPDGQTNYLIPGSIIAAGVIIALAVLYSNGAPSLKRDTKNTSPDTAAYYASDDPILGDPNAKVAVVEFSDFQCPFCEQFFQSVEPGLVRDYVRTGKVKFVYRDFPLSSIHPMAEKAAEAGQCAKEENKFWQMHDAIFQNQPDLSIANLKLWAKNIGLDQAKFNDCLDSGKYAEAIAKEVGAGTRLGVNGTPFTFVNGIGISGAQPYAQFKAAIEAALEAAK
ncbi:MAG: DsbA family protein [Candidatus Sungbacteria bacterium]|uniref:DsbA family protein n=1 Tax=Candidatus Sungiibacteriota bacterium TaxID=2750080 RepID=A0A9D6LUI9_9BACT|nr:DsbA family protein [Candidatus Sungbacteria bacterium]